MKAIRIYISLLVVTALISSVPSHCQPTISPEYSHENVNGRLALYNIGFGFINGAVGVLINEKNSSFRDVIVKGGLQGAMGGFLVHKGKSLMIRYAQSERLSDYWASYGLFSLGTSVIENASFNRWFYEKVTFHYLFARIQFDLSEQRVGIGMNYSEFASNAIFAINHQDKYELDWKRSLSHGVFISYPKDPVYMKGVRGKNTFNGGIQLNLERIEREIEYKVLAHELIHKFQDIQFQLYSNWGNRWIEEKLLPGVLKKERKRKIYFYSEVLGPFAHDMLAYTLADALADPENHYSNIFEMEGKYYSRGH